MRYVIGITAYVDNTTVFYDHWEDGYDFNETDFTVADETYTANHGAGIELCIIQCSGSTSTFSDSNSCLWGWWFESIMALQRIVTMAGIISM